MGTRRHGFVPVAFAVVLVASACGSAPAVTPAPSAVTPSTPAATTPASPTPATATAAPPQGPAPTATPTARPDGQTSLGLIDDALRAGTIDEEAATAYKLFHLFDDPRLPAEFAAPLDTQSNEGERFLRELRARYPTLTPTMQELVGPFLVQPFYQGSWWDRQQRAMRPGNLALAAVSPVTAATTPPLWPCSPTATDPCPVSPDWTSLTTSNGKVRIWYPIAMPGGLTQAERARSDIDTILWPELVEALGKEPKSDAGYPNNGIDGLIDIAIVDAEVRSHVEDLKIQLPVGVECQDTAGYMILAPYDRLVLAHEFMHLIEFAYPAQGGSVCNSWDWIDEGVANWAANLVHPGAGYGHIVGQRFLDQLEFTLNHHDDTREYGTWLFWLYLSKVFGPDIIGDIYEARASQRDTLKAIDTAIPGGFKERWKEFALYAWNRDPITYLRDWVAFEGWPEPLASQSPPIELGGEGDQVIELESIALEPLSAWHLRFVVPPDVRSFGIYNGLGHTLRVVNAEMGAILTPSEAMPDQPGLHIWALLKINGTWAAPEDWTYLPYRHFCTDVLAERVEEVVLIFANGDFADPGRRLRATGSPMTLFASNVGCARWEGEITWTYRDENGFETVTARDLVFERDPEQVGPLGGGHLVNYITTAGTLDWEYRFTPGSCSITGSGAGLAIEGYHTLYTTNFLLSGPYHRAAGATVRAVEPESYTESCPNEADKTFDHFVGLAFPGGAEPGRVSEDGGTISGIYRHEEIEVRWHLVAVRE